MLPLDELDNTGCDPNVERYMYFNEEKEAILHFPTSSANPVLIDLLVNCARYLPHAEMLLWKHQG